MTKRPPPGWHVVRTVRWLTIGSLSLTSVALLLCLLFVWHTTGGTLFLFSTLSPILVLAAIAMIVGATILEYRRTHKLFVIERYPTGQVIFRQGDDGDSAYFIRDGEVDVVDEETGDVLATLGVGDYFGEMALLADSPRNATVRTRSSVELAVLGKENFLNMVHLLPSTEEAILSTVQRRAIRGETAETG